MTEFWTPEQLAAFEEFLKRGKASLRQPAATGVDSLLQPDIPVEKAPRVSKVEKIFVDPKEEVELFNFNQSRGKMSPERKGLIEKLIEEQKNRPVRPPWDPNNIPPEGLSRGTEQSGLRASEVAYPGQDVNPALMETPHDFTDVAAHPEPRMTLEDTYKYLETAPKRGRGGNVVPRVIDDAVGNVMRETPEQAFEKAAISEARKAALKKGLLGLVLGVLGLPLMAGDTWANTLAQPAGESPEELRQLQEQMSGQ